MKILIAEDETNIAEGIVNTIQANCDFKCQFKLAADGEAALKTATQFSPDLIITDIRMPHLTGLELIQSLQQEAFCKNFIIISGYDNFSYAQAAIRYGVMAYLLKPISKSELIELVHKVYKSLPVSHMNNIKHITPDLPYFHLDLTNKLYPASLKKVLNYLSGNYMKEISLQTLSEEFMLNPSYISSLFSKYTNQNFTYIMDYLRLSKACEILLYEPDLTINEISYLVGYNNERRLYHAFQKYLKCTPGEFKNKYISATFSS